MIRASLRVALTVLLASIFGWAQGGSYTTQFRVSPPAPTAPNPFSPGSSTSRRFNSSALSAAHRSSGVFIRNRILSPQERIQVPPLPMRIRAPYWVPPGIHPRSPFDYDLQAIDPSPHQAAGKSERDTLEAVMGLDTPSKFKQGKTSDVILQSTPEGADTYVDGYFVGDTPITVPIASGPHRVSIRQWGYQAWKRALTVVAGRKISLDAILREQ